MKIKRVVVCFGILMISLLGGCFNDNSDNVPNNAPFITYDISCIDFYNECSVCNSEEEIIVYFPVVTNKEITMIETGGISAVLNRKDLSEVNTITIGLEKKEQDFINIKFENYYISFIKYRVKFSDWKNLNFYNSINLCETRIWIYNKEEYQTVDYDNTYMDIKIVQNTEERVHIDWTMKLDVMLNEIKTKLRETSY